MKLEQDGILSTVVNMIFDNFEKVYGSPLTGAFLFDETHQDLIEYEKNNVATSFYKDIVCHITLNKKHKLLTEQEVEELIKQHTPPDSKLVLGWKWRSGIAPMQTKEYYSQTVSDIFPFTDKNPKHANISVTVTRDMKNKAYTAVNISVIEMPLSPEEQKRKKEELKAKREKEEAEDKKFKEETQKEIDKMPKRTQYADFPVGEPEKAKQDSTKGNS